jgi:cytidylate kinase
VNGDRGSIKSEEGAGLCWKEQKMSYRTLTISREYGSGGANIAKLIAERLGWELLDRGLIEAIARAGHVDEKVVTRLDERAESWLARINLDAMHAASIAAGVIPDLDTCFDPDVMTELTRRIVDEAHTHGNCVIVGRGAQCILQNKPDVFHAFVYAPLHDRIARLQKRLGSEVDLERRIHAVDSERAHYLRQRFSREWNDPHLYDMMICSHKGEEATAKVILCALTV